MQCRNCGDVVASDRAALGYDYCLKEECQQRCLKRVRLAAVAVNKAADYYTSADEVVRPVKAPTPSIDADGEGDARVPRAPRPAPKKLPTTLQRLREHEAVLNAALQQSYERFCRGETTAAAMDRERQDLIGAFNQRVRNENIRYHSLLRDR